MYMEIPNFAPRSKQIGHPYAHYNITAEGLEGLLVNATLSTLAMGNWTTSAVARHTEYTAFYKFGNPRAILVPYTITLSFALLFVVLGMASLISNGVMAQDVGFLQVACTTTGSAALERAAAAACLGGDANTANPRLADMRLLYGELAADANGPRRAGFGPPEHVRPLVKGARYGCADDDADDEDRPFLA